MNPANEEEVTQILHRLNRGDEKANKAFYTLIYDELHRIAHNLMKGERKDHTLQTTALVHEAYLRLIPKTAIQWKDRLHFMKAASGTMRAILVDHARKKKAKKRAAEGKRIVLDKVLAWYEQRAIDIIALNDALDEFRKIDEERAQLFELRMFGGLTAKESAQVTGVSLRSAEKGFLTARAWMMSRLEM